MITDPYEIGKENLRRVREYFETHLCATQKECARALGIAVKTVHSHVQKIRAEWRGNKQGPHQSDDASRDCYRDYDPENRHYDNEIIK